MKYSAANYTQALVKALEGKSDRESEDILRRAKDLARTNGEARVLPAIFRAVAKRLAQQKNAQTMRMVSALALSEKEKQSLKNKFSAQEYEFEVNKNILAGLVIQLGTKLCHYTLRNTLERIGRP